MERMPGTLSWRAARVSGPYAPSSRVHTRFVPHLLRVLPAEVCETLAGGFGVLGHGGIPYRRRSSAVQAHRSVR